MSFNTKKATSKYLFRNGFLLTTFNEDRIHTPWGNIKGLLKAKKKKGRGNCARSTSIQGTVIYEDTWKLEYPRFPWYFHVASRNIVHFLPVPPFTFCFEKLGESAFFSSRDIWPERVAMRTKNRVSSFFHSNQTESNLLRFNLLYFPFVPKTCLPCSLYKSYFARESLFKHHFLSYWAPFYHTSILS